LRLYISVLRRRKWSIALVTLVVVGAAMAYTLRQTPLYTSEARVLVAPIGPGATLASLNMSTEQALVHSAAVAAVVEEDLGLSQSGGLLSGLGVSVEANTQILDINYTSPIPPTAQRIAQAFATAYLKFRQQQAVEQVQSQEAGIQAQIDSTQSELAQVDAEIRQAKGPIKKSQLSAQHDSLIAQLGALHQQLESLQATVASQAGGQVVQPAPLPASPSSPQKVRNGILALFVGLALGTGVAFLRERLDDRLRGSEDLEASVQAPILAVVPMAPDWKDRKLSELVSIAAPKSSTSEAYRTLRTNLQFVEHSGDVRVICVTSGALGEGKTTTVANLGVALGQAGRKVILVSCDLRRPRLHKFFGLGNETGLSSVLSGSVDLASAVQRPSEMDNIVVLASGPIPPNPAELLVSERMRKVVEELREATEFLIFDSPPLFAVADALSIAAMSDGSMLVADANSTTRTAARHARQQLDQVGARVVGAVLNNFDPFASRYSYGYDGYRYAYTYRYREEDSPRKRRGGHEESNGDSRNGRQAQGPERPSVDLRRPDDSMWG